MTELTQSHSIYNTVYTSISTLLQVMGLLLAGLMLLVLYPTHLWNYVGTCQLQVSPVTHWWNMTWTVSPSHCDDWKHKVKTSNIQHNNIVNATQLANKNFMFISITLSLDRYTNKSFYFYYFLSKSDWNLPECIIYRLSGSWCIRKKWSGNVKPLAYKHQSLAVLIGSWWN